MTLFLPKPRSLKHLTVRLSGRQDIGFPGGVRPYESELVLEKEVSLVPTKDEVNLERGEHEFRFVIHVPSNTPGFEKCQFGRVRHWLTVKVSRRGCDPWLPRG